MKRKTFEIDGETVDGRGIYWDKSRNKYVIQVTYKNKNYYLGSSDDLKECLAIRDEARQHLTTDFLDWYTEWRKQGKVKKPGTYDRAVKNPKNALIDITGKRVGRLKVLRYDKKRHMWKCKCDCGNVIYAKGIWLNRKEYPLDSCGCWKKCGYNIPKSRNGAYGVRIIPSSRSTTGVRGVHVSNLKTGKRYSAEISYDGKRYTIVTSKDIEVCIKARKEAEAHYDDEDFLKWLKEYKKHNKRGGAE